MTGKQQSIEQQSSTSNDFSEERVKLNSTTIKDEIKVNTII